MIPHKKCGTCGEVKMKIEFGYSSDGLQTDCRSCARARWKKKRDEIIKRAIDPTYGRSKAEKGKYYKDNPETKRRANASRRTVDGAVVYPSNPHHPDYVRKTRPDAFTHPELPRIEEEQRVRYRKADADEARAKDGFVYVISHPSFPDRIKIGKARNPNKRLADANTWCPDNGFVIRGAFFFEDALSVERQVHLIHAHHREDGEWFRMSAEQAVLTILEIDHSQQETGDDEVHSSRRGSERVPPCRGHGASSFGKDGWR